MVSFPKGTSVSTNRRNNEVRGGPGVMHRVQTYTNITGSVKLWKTCHKMLVDIEIFFTVYSI